MTGGPVFDHNVGIGETLNYLVVAVSASSCLMISPGMTMVTVTVDHPEIRVEGQEGVNRHVVKVPVEIELEADEVSLIHLLHSLVKTPKKGASYVGVLTRSTASPLRRNS